MTLLLAVPAATAATMTLSVGIDTDNDPVTGIERLASAVVTTTSAGATVTRLEQQRCNAGTLSAAALHESGGWPVGFGNGTGGSAVVEYAIPHSALGAVGTMRAVAVGSSVPTTNYSEGLRCRCLSGVVPLASLRSRPPLSSQRRPMGPA